MSKTVFKFKSNVMFANVSTPPDETNFALLPTFFILCPGLLSIK